MMVEWPWEMRSSTEGAAKWSEVNAAISSEAVTMTALTRNCSVSRISRVSASRKPLSIAEWAFPRRHRRDIQPLSSRGSDIAARAWSDTVCLSVERSAESRYRNRHRQQHESYQRQ